MLFFLLFGRWLDSDSSFSRTEPPVRQGGGKVEDVDGFIGKLKELGAI